MSFIHSIKFRFTAWYLLVLAVLLVALGTGVYFYLSRSLYQSLDESLELRSTQIRNIQDILESIREGQFQGELGEIVMLYFYAGNQLVEVPSQHISIPLTPEFVSQAIYGKELYTTVETEEGERLRVLAVPVNLNIVGPPPGPQPAALVIARSTKQID